MNPLNQVRESAKWICSRALNVKIIHNQVQHTASQIDDQQLSKICSPHAFDHEIHYFDGGPLTAQYLLILDCINFCFWPENGIEYEHLAKGLKESVEKDSQILDADKLMRINGQQLRSIVNWNKELPLEEERVRLIQEVGYVLNQKYQGEARNLILAAEESAVKLVNLVVANFPGFRDHCIYKGKQVFFYKRAQIFVGDLWGCFNGHGLGKFNDIEQLTMFADYRVPVVLREMGILEYSKELAYKVDHQIEIVAGSAEEVEIRAATIEAIELLKAMICARNGKRQSPLYSLQLDWWLWEIGEINIQNHKPHHRVLTTYY